MQVGKNTVATLHYTLKDREGHLIDQSRDGSFSYLHGAGNIVLGLENALEGKRMGDHVEVEIPPELAYGVRHSKNLHKVPLDRLPQEGPVQPGMSFRALADNGQGIVVTVTQVDADGAVVDANHPLAGVTLCFAVDVVAIRAATAEEVSHGHAHNAEGHVCA